MMVSHFLADANSSLGRVSKYQNQVDSTKRVGEISDDPQATMTALKARNKLSSLDAYQGNIQTASSYLEEAESAAYGLNEILQTVYEEVVLATGGSKIQEDFDVFAEELISLQEEVISIGNATVGTCYIFGGYNFSGTTDGVSFTAPFSIDKISGHLIYNGMDLSRISWAEEYGDHTALMPSYGAAISANAAALGGTASDEYARDTLCGQALGSLNSLIASGEAALNAAKQFGIDASCTAYQDLSKLIYGVGEEGDAGYVAGLSDLAGELYNECSRELAQNLEDDTNAFSISAAQTILDSVTELISNSSPATGLDYDMTQAIAGLQNELDADTAYAGSISALAGEAEHQAVLQIGTTQSVGFTFPGTDLIGTGTDNVYFVLDKCITMLKNGDTKGLSHMISEIQSAQSNVLCFQTEIGAAKNRMSLIGSRYDSSVINYTEMQSNAVDVDMAEAIVNLTTAMTVYKAALAGGAEIIQTSLIDFLT